MPFRWTINPYQGMQPCLRLLHWGERRSSWRMGGHGRSPTCRAGDEISAPSRAGAYRRYVTTEVLAHWSTIKPAYRVTLEDGTELIASGDHRFLTRPRLEARRRAHERAGAASAPDDEQRAARDRALRRRRRPSRARLQARLSLRDDPRRRAHRHLPRTTRPTVGRGDDRTGSASRSPTSRRCGARSDYLLDGRASHTTEFAVPPGGGARSAPMPAIRTSARAKGRPDRRARSAWPLLAERRLAQGLPGRDLRRRGLLRPSGVLRISNTDRRDPGLDAAHACGDFGFDCVEEPTQARTALSMRAGARRAPRAAALLPPHRPGDHPQARRSTAWR